MCYMVKSRSVFNKAEEESYDKKSHFSDEDGQRFAGGEDSVPSVKHSEYEESQKTVQIW